MTIFNTSIYFFLFFLLLTNRAISGKDDYTYISVWRNTVYINHQDSAINLERDIETNRLKIERLNGKIIKLHKKKEHLEESYNKEIQILPNFPRTTTTTLPKNREICKLYNSIKKEKNRIFKISKKIKSEDAILNIKNIKNRKNRKNRIETMHKYNKHIAKLNEMNKKIIDTKEEYLKRTRKEPRINKTTFITSALLPILVNITDNNKCRYCDKNTDNRFKLISLSAASEYDSDYNVSDSFCELTGLSNEDEDKTKLREFFAAFNENEGQIHEHSCCECWLKQYGDHSEYYRINSKLEPLEPAFKRFIRNAHIWNTEKDNNSETAETTKGDALQNPPVTQKPETIQEELWNPPSTSHQGCEPHFESTQADEEDAPLLKNYRDTQETRL